MRSSLLLVLSVLAFAGPAPAQTPATPPPVIFEPVPSGAVHRFFEDAAAVRQQNVFARGDLLRADDTRGFSAEPAILIPLFDGEIVAAEFVATASAYGGGTVSEYAVAGGGTAIFSMVDDAMTATIRLGDRLFKVNHAGLGQQTLSLVDEFLVPPCATGHPSTPGAEAPETRYEENYAVNNIDVLVVYTTAARTNNGGDAGMVSLINLALYETNQGYSQSDVACRMNLVHVEHVAYVEGGNEGTYLSHLVNGADGQLDGVPPLRDAYGADLVAMIYRTGTACGQANQVICNLNAANAAGAYCVVDDGCATGNYSFGHELGHLQGAQHDRANTAGCGLTTYCYGWRTTDSVHRTIMAYAPGTRINFWSNPNKLSPNGLALGVANSEENWRTLNFSATTIAAYRTAKTAAHGVLTKMTSNNGFAGNMFDVVTKADLRIYALYVNTSAPAGTNVTFDVWVRHGTYVGREGSSAGWWLLASGNGTSAGQDQFTTVQLNAPTVLQSGRTYGVFVNLTNYGGGNSLRYTDNTGLETFEDDHLKISCGAGKGNGGFAGATIANRTWNGVIWYYGSSGYRSLTTTWAGGNGAGGIMFDVTAARNIRINSFDINVDASADPGNVTADVWVRNGTYAGNESNPYAWTFLGSDFRTIAGFVGGQTRVAVPGVALSGGQTRAFYIHLASSAGGHVLRYTNGNTNYSNADLTVTAGAGKGTAAFTSTTFASRVFNGDVNYQLSEFNNLGNQLAGTFGFPALWGGGGPLYPGETVNLLLGNARQNALAALVVGPGTLYAPFKGGILVPAIGSIYVLATDGAGSINATFPWPQGVPPGTSLFMQYWIQDPAGPAGYSASNAIEVATP